MRLVFHAGDCRQVLKDMAESSFDSVVTDPPGGLSFLENAWDTFDKKTFGVAGMEGEKDLKVVKGFHTLPRFAGTDMSLFQEFMFQVFSEVRRVLKPGAHGFIWSTQKTHHHAMMGVERAGLIVKDLVTHWHSQGFPKNHDLVRAGASSEWSGWGTALKPAAEFWSLIQKPVSESNIVANVKRWGVGALNLEACRVQGGEKSTLRAGRADIGYHGGLKAVADGEGYITGRDDGTRWPANLMFSHTLDCTDRFCIHGCPVAVARDQMGRDPAGFFYTPKPGKREKTVDGRIENAHPTVKSVALMRWLMTLVTPSRGMILDPFSGSGTGAVAATEAGFGWTGIEADPGNYELGVARIRAVSQSHGCVAADHGGTLLSTPVTPPPQEDADAVHCEAAAGIRA